MRIDFKDSERQIAAFARRVLRRAHAAGGDSVQLSDITSELAVAWCIARDKFDPQQGVLFSTFLHRGMIFHINRWIQDQITHGHAKSMDVDDGQRPMQEIIPADQPSPYDELEADDSRRKMLLRLHGDSRRFVELLSAPTPELIEMLSAARARTSYARARGLKGVTPAPKDVTAPMVMDMMGLGRAERAQVFKDVRAVSQR